jgi:hypothetical protein
MNISLCLLLNVAPDRNYRYVKSHYDRKSPSTEDDSAALFSRKLEADGYQGVLFLKRNIFVT